MKHNSVAHRRASLRSHLCIGYFPLDRLLFPPTRQSTCRSLDYFDDHLYKYLSMLSQATLTARFAALADPTRLAMVQRLAGADLSVSELARPFALSQPTITSHLNVLERAGLIERHKVAQSRICRLKP